MRKKQTAKQRKTEETTVVQEFVVEKIIRRRIFNGRVEYFLKWKGFTEWDVAQSAICLLIICNIWAVVHVFKVYSFLFPDISTVQKTHGNLRTIWTVLSSSKSSWETPTSQRRLRKSKPNKSSSLKKKWRSKRRKLWVCEECGGGMSVRLCLFPCYSLNFLTWIKVLLESFLYSVFIALGWQVTLRKLRKLFLLKKKEAVLESSKIIWPYWQILFLLFQRILRLNMKLKTPPTTSVFSPSVSLISYSPTI